MNQTRHKSPFDESPEGQRAKFVFDSTFSMLAKLVCADGVISSDEKREVGRFISDVLKLDKERTAYAIVIFQEAKQSQAPFENYAERYYQLFATNDKMREWMLDTLYRTSMVDGLCDEEEELLQQAAEIFRLPPKIVSRVRARHISENDSYYQTLGCTADDSDETITARYQVLITENCPEKVKSFGLPSEFHVLAEERILAIEAAYLVIQQQRQA